MFVCVCACEFYCARSKPLFDHETRRFPRFRGRMVKFGSDHACTRTNVTMRIVIILSVSRRLMNAFSLYVHSLVVYIC
jgi:hypothetical protein